MEPHISSGTTDSSERTVVFGKYELLKRIAQGGMAELFAARMRSVGGVDKIVVIKRILPELARNRQFVEWFLDEARIAASLNHANVVQVHDIDSVDGNYFIAMEYLHGEDLGAVRKALRREGSGFPLPMALRLVADVAAGLHYAHEKCDLYGEPLGIVHRDVSPRNVFLTYDGAVKLVDFGIAKARNRMTETRTGTLKGKFPYMSPEQVCDDRIDRRSDVFSLGILLWEVTTSSRLFAGESDYAVLKKIVEQPIPTPSSLVKGYPAELEAIVMRALDKDREQRYPTAQAMQADLERLARRHKLDVSSIALAELMARLFGKKMESWRDAVKEGRDLGALVKEWHEGTGATEDPDSGDESIVITFGSPARWRRPRVRGSWLAATVGALAFAALAAWVSWPPGRAALADDVATPVALAKPVAEAPPAVAEAPLPVAEAPLPVAEAPLPLAAVPAPEPPPVTAAAVEVEVAEAPVAAKAEPRRSKRRARRERPSVRAAQPVEAASSEPGELRISSVPSCEVLVDGRPVGATPVVGVKLAPGSHQVRLISSRFGIDRSYSVTVSPGQVSKKKYRFPTDP